MKHAGKATHESPWIGVPIASVTLIPMPAKPPVAPEAWLELSDGRIHRLSGSCSIGRLAGNQLALADAGISRHHAGIAPNQQGVYILSDLGSTNGTLLNGRPLAGPAGLRDGDQIGIGAALVRFRLATNAAGLSTEVRRPAPARRKVLVVGETSLLGEGLLRWLEAQPEFAVAGRAADAARARQLHGQLHPDAVLIDASSDAIGYLTLIRDLLAAEPEGRILVLVERADPSHVPRILRAGALGCILKGDPGDELQRALQSVVAGSVYLSRRVAAATLRQLAGSEEAGRRGGPGGLTDRELEIFHLIGGGKQNRDIATALGMSVKTVETHKENIKVKLDVSSAADLAGRARAWVAGQGAVK
jgi:DNA-binding NarL/FixJ family response regulator